MKVHLCCGDVYLEGYENVDTYGSMASVVKNNVNKTTIDKYYTNDLFTQKSPIIDRQLSLPHQWDYPLYSLDEVLMICALEHFSKEDARKLILYIYMSLKDGGVFKFDFPDIFETVNKYKDKPDEMMRLIYGSGKNPWAFHRYGYTKETIAEILNEFPWASIEFTEIIKHDYPMIGVIATK